MRTHLTTLALAASLAIGSGAVFAYDRDYNPPGPVGGPGTNWENPPGPMGGPGASPDFRFWGPPHHRPPLPYYRHHPRRYGWPHPLDRDDNPPGKVGGPGTNWENPPGPEGGPGTSPNRKPKADRDDNPPGRAGGPGTNWENPPGPRGGPGASPDRRY